MAALRRSVLLPRTITTFLNKQRSISSSAVVHKGWNKDWMPGPYPVSEKEHQEASRQHGLLPEDYRPLSDDGDGIGDYPDFPVIGEEQKSPWENWDDPYMRRNFGEPMHIYYESIMNDKGDPGKKYRFSPRVMLATVTTLVLTYVGLMLFTMPYGMTNSRYSDWYPYDDVKTFERGKPVPTGQPQIHYTFEPAE